MVFDSRISFLRVLPNFRFSYIKDSFHKDSRKCRVLVYPKKQFLYVPNIYIIYIYMIYVYYMCIYNVIILCHLYLTPLVAVVSSVYINKSLFVWRACVVLFCAARVCAFLCPPQASDRAAHLQTSPQPRD